MAGRGKRAKMLASVKGLGYPGCGSDAEEGDAMLAQGPVFMRNFRISTGSGAVCPICRMRRLMVAALLLGAGAGCTLSSPENGFLSGLTGAERPAPLTRATLGGGDIILQGPKGWCIEPSSLRARQGDNFASLAGCHALTQGSSGAPVPYGILTVAVSAPRAPGDVDVQQALRQGVSDRSLLSTRIENGVALVHLAPGRSANAEGLGDPHWRAVFVQGRRVVMLAAYGPDKGEISGETGGRLMLALARAIRRSSPDQPGARPAGSENDLGTRLKRLFN